MKKTFLGAALLLVISATQASAAPSFPQESRAHVKQNILSSELPKAVQEDIKKDYKDYWITSLSEEPRGKHSDYYMTVENADQVMELRSNDATTWEVTKTTLKGE